MRFHCWECGYGKPIVAADLTSQRLQEMGTQMTCTKCGATMDLIVRRRYRGEPLRPYFLVKDVVHLDELRTGEDPERGRFVFDPRFVLLQKEGSKKEFLWNPYWITLGGKRKYGQFAPMMTEEEFSELLAKAIRRSWFGKTLRDRLRTALGSG